MTVIGPVPAPAGTVAMILVDELDVIDAVTPLNLTTFSEGVAPKVVPVISTTVPDGPDSGVNPVIAGVSISSVTLNGSELDEHPLSAVTVTVYSPGARAACVVPVAPAISL